MSAPRTNDYDLRHLVVSALLAYGIPREAIRHEITLDMSSSDGRADMVIALDRELIGIEIKSGKDTLERLDSQRERYSCRFDKLCLVVDDRHLPKDDFQRINFVHRLRFGAVGVVSNGVLSCECGYAPWAAGPSWKDSHQRRDRQSSHAMLSLLWAQEIVQIGSELVVSRSIPHFRPVRYVGIPHLAEHASIATLRPLIAKSLRKRPLNRWEESFWSKFDLREVAA